MTDTTITESETWYQRELDFLADAGRKDPWSENGLGKHWAELIAEGAERLIDPTFELAGLHLSKDQRFRLAASYIAIAREERRSSHE